MEPVKPCPFCGSTQSITVCSAPDSRYWIKCYDCGTTGPVSITKNDAVLLWNAAANQLAAKDAEIERLTAALAEAEEERHETVSKLRLALIREANGDKRQDELEAEIARLTEACDDLEGEYLRMKEHSENLMLRINQLEEYKETWYKRAMESLDQRDEAKAEIAEHRRHVATVMKRETILKQELEKANGLIGILESQPDGIEIEHAKAIAERDEARRVARHWYIAAKRWMLEFDLLCDLMYERRP